MLSTFCLVLLAAGAIHRVWIYEEVARPFRERLLTFLRPRSAFLHKLFSCGVCFAFWATIAACALWYIEPLSVAPFALYAALRLGLSTVSYAQQLLEIVIRNANRAALGTPVQAPAQQTTPAPPTISITASCTTCGKKAPITTKRPVVIFTVFNAFDASYSLVGVALDQARALALEGHPVEFWSSVGSDTRQWPRDMPPNVTHFQTVPRITWKEDVVDPSAVTQLEEFIKAQVKRLPVGTTIITHDLQFLTSYVSFGQALRNIGKTQSVRWLHMAHSRAAATRPTTPEGKLRSTLVDGHFLLYPSPIDRAAMAAYFDIDQSRVFDAPNIRDITIQNRWDPRAAKFAQEKGLLTADIVQVYPFSMPRARAKGVDTVLTTFSELKKLGNTVRLVLVSAHNAGNGPKQERDTLVTRITELGLTEDVVWTSDYAPEWSDGVPGEVVAQLQQAGNVFVFPSISESCGMVMLEAGLNGQLLVLNSALPTMFDAVARENAIYVNFKDTGADGLVSLADRISGHLALSKENRAKRGILATYSLAFGGRTLTTAVERAWQG